MRRPSGNHWWVTGDSSIYSRCDNRVSCIELISNGLWSVIWRLKNCCLPSNHALIRRKSLYRLTENGIELETKEGRKTDIRIPDSICGRKPISCSESM